VFWIAVLALVTDALIVLWTLAVSTRRMVPAALLAGVLEGERLLSVAWVNHLPVYWVEITIASFGSAAGAVVGLLVAGRLLRGRNVA
jgi:hypothetical protein